MKQAYSFHQYHINLSNLTFMAPFWHRFPHFHCYKVSKRASRLLGKPHKIQLFTDYSIIVATRPEPTVRPPSRSAWAVSSNWFVTVLCFFIHLLYVFFQLFCFSSEKMYHIRITKIGSLKHVF